MKQKTHLLKRSIYSHWPHWVGGITLGVLNVILTLIYKPWSITGDIADWGFRLWSLLGGHPENWEAYFQEVGYQSLVKNPIYNEQMILNTGLIIGVLLAAALASEFRIKRIKSCRQVVIALAGGVLMGYGARLALGCNVGAMIGGIASQSLHGWIFGLFLIFGAFLGSVIVRDYLMKIK